MIYTVEIYTVTLVGVDGDGGDDYCDCCCYLSLLYDNGFDD